MTKKRTLGTLGEAIDDAHDWIDRSGIDPEDYELRQVVQVHYRWSEKHRSFRRIKPGRFVGLYRDPVMD